MADPRDRHRISENDFSKGTRLPSVASIPVRLQINVLISAPFTLDDLWDNAAMMLPVEPTVTVTLNAPTRPSHGRPT